MNKLKNFLLNVLNFIAKMEIKYQVINLERKCFNVFFLYQILKKCLKLQKIKNLNNKLEKLLKIKLHIKIYKKLIT